MLALRSFLRMESEGERQLSGTSRPHIAFRVTPVIPLKAIIASPDGWCKDVHLSS